MNGTNPQPFSLRAVVALVVLGSAIFLLLLWMMGAGMMSGSTNDGGAHADGRGLNGYAGLAELMERRGFEVQRVRTEARLDDPGLLILTPPADAKGKDIAKIVHKRRFIGPTLVILPKWIAVPTPPASAGSRSGWVQLAGTEAPRWPGFRDDISVTIRPTTAPARWWGTGVSGTLPAPSAVETGHGRLLVPLVANPKDGGVLAAYIADEGNYPQLERIAFEPPPSYGDEHGVYPLVFVFEPDLLNNYGMAKRENALLADRLIRAATATGEKTIRFDLTLNGLARSTNLLTLAFTPPFLAATLCLILAAIVVGWRAFLRFGPAQAQERAIAFGKHTLVANTAGLIRRTGRLRLVATPYATHARERIAHALGLPRFATSEATEEAIDRAMATRFPDIPPFSVTAARMRAARPHDLLRAAQDLHSLERMLTR